MKHLLTCFLLAGCVATSPTDAPRGSSTATIETGLTPDEAFRHAAQVLAGAGYPIESSDANTGVITAGYYEMRPNPISMRIRLTAAVSGGVVSLRGQYISGSDGLTLDIEQIGMNGSPAQHAWAELDRIAHAIGSKISYK